MDKVNPVKCGKSKKLWAKDFKANLKKILTIICQRSNVFDVL